MTKHNLVYTDIKAKIDEGVYQTGTLLPSESGLMALYSASRDTIRKALARLREEGYIQSQKGKGSTVINRQRYVFPVAGVVSYKELASRLSMNTATRLIELRTVTLPGEPFQSIEPHLRTFKATKVVRQRIVNDEPVIIDIDYIDQRIVPEISQSVAEDSLYAYFEHDLHLEIAYAKKEFTVEPDQQLLGVTASDVVVVVRSATSLADTRTFQYTESRHRADRFRFQEFARRL